MPQQSQQPPGFAHLYPNIARWVQSYGWIEMGADHDRSSLLRAWDTDGIVWESKADDATLDDTLRVLESFLAQRMREFYS
jgi:hypothetical protein